MKLEGRIKLYYLFKFFQNSHFFGAVLIPFFTVWAGMTGQTALLLQSWFMICITILELPTGIVADKFGRKKSLVLGAMFATLGLLIYGIYPNIYLFLAGELLIATASAFVSGADEAWIVDTLIQFKAKDRKTEVIGKGQSLTFTGMIIGTLIGGLIASHISLNATMYLSAIPALLMLFVASRMPETIIHKTESEVFRWKQAFSSLKVLFSNHHLRLLAINLILVAVPAYFVMWLYQPLLQKINIDVKWFGVIQALFVSFEALLSHRFGLIEKKIGINRYLILSALITTIGFFSLAIKQNIFTIIFFVLTAGSFGLSRRYFAVGHFHDFVSSTYRASISSSFSILLRLSNALANIFIGWLFIRSTSMTLVFLGLLPVIALLFVPLNQVFENK
jgi:MFS family permease